MQVSLHGGNTSEIVRLLLEDKISVGPIEGPTRDRGVHTERFMEDELVLITHSISNLTVCPPVNLQHQLFSCANTLQALAEWLSLPLKRQA